MNQRRQKQHRRAHATTSSPKPALTTQPFHEHLRELRKRLMFVAISVLVWGGAAYAVQQHLVALLVRPAHGEKFIYTSPGGGIDFLFRICVYSGIVLSLPVIVYNSLRYIEPLITKSSRRFIILGSLGSGILAVAGVVFGYFLGLPAALHFLLHQFTTIQIQPLVTIQSYLSFVIVYMVGSSMLFQLPLILLFVNRIKPLKPSKLFHYERWVILAAFVLAGLMNPTPNVISQLMVAGPFILMYQIGILLIAVVNHSRQPQAATPLLQQDTRLQQARAQRAQTAQKVFAANALPSKPVAPRVMTVPKRPTPAPAAPIAMKPTYAANDMRNRYRNQPGSTVNTARPRQYLDGFMGTPSYSSRLSSDF